MTDESEMSENRFSRWSKQKQKARQTREAEKIEKALDAQPELSAEAIAQMEAEQTAREQQLQSNRIAAEAVDLEKFDDSSDFSVFMKDGVPDILRRKAYRLLWRSNPILANLDGLNDYDENFADPSMTLKVFKSAWDVTKGYAKNEDVVEEGADLAEDLTGGEQIAADEKPAADDNSDLGAKDADETETEEAQEAEPIAASEEIQLEQAVFPDKVMPDLQVNPSEEVAKVPLRQRLNLGGDWRS